MDYTSQETKPTTYRTFYFYPPDKSQPMVILVTQSQTRDPEGEFQQTYRHYEARNWTINERKKEETVNEPQQIHPQTGEPIGQDNDDSM